jgi:VanZ family protein
LRRLLILIVAMIVYGSLYPWHFAMPHLAANPFWILVNAWHPDPLPFLFRDVLVNIALYVPFGFAAHAVFRKSRLPGFSIYGPVLLGLLLSVGMELAQLWVPRRETSMIDVVTNVIGSALGVALSVGAEAMVPRMTVCHSLTNLKGSGPDQGALLLAFAWAASLFFPLFPVLGTYQPLRKFIVFQHAGLLSGVPFVSSAASWYAAALLLRAAGVRLSRGRLFMTLLAIPAQFFIVERQPLPSMILGAIAGIVLFLLVQRPGRGPTRVEVWAFLFAIIFRGLSPFRFVTASGGFNWIPFGVTLGGDWQSAYGVLVEKIFYYGTAIWLFSESGVMLVRSVLLVAGVLAAIEITQMHLPGRTPEITDPILAIMMGFVLAAFSRGGRTAGSIPAQS